MFKLIFSVLFFAVVIMAAPAPDGTNLPLPSSAEILLMKQILDAHIRNSSSGDIENISGAPINVLGKSINEDKNGVESTDDLEKSEFGWGWRWRYPVYGRVYYYPSYYYPRYYPYYW